MRAIHIDGERGLRGGERQLLLLAAERARRGSADLVACRAGSPLEAESRRAGLEVLPLPLLTEFDPVSAWKLRSAARRRGALLHAHTSHAAGIAALAARGGGPVRVVHRRVSFPPGRSGLDWKYGGAEAVLAVSEHVRRSLVGAGLASVKIFTAPDALLPSSSAAAPRRDALALELGLPVGGFWLGCLAALTPEKGHATLLRALARLRLDRPDAVLLLAGEGPLESELRSLAWELGVSDAVRFLGWRADGPQMTGLFDLYVQPSLEEGLGGSVLEALSRGAAVVASRTGGLPELVRDGKTGWLAAPGAVDDWARVLKLACADPASRRTFGEAGRRLASDFTVERMADRVEEAYRFASSGAREAAAA